MTRAKVSKQAQRAANALKDFYEDSLQISESKNITDYQKLMEVVKNLEFVADAMETKH